MNIYILRHAEAERIEPDEARPLTAKGQKTVKDLARFLRKRGLCEVEEVWHSPLVRAKETSDLLLRKMKVEVPASEERLLEPEADIAQLAERLAEQKGDLLLVGHNPHLENLIAFLATGRFDKTIVDMKKGAMACLERTDPILSGEQGGNYVIRWMLISKIV